MKESKIFVTSEYDALQFCTIAGCNHSTKHIVKLFKQTCYYVYSSLNRYHTGHVVSQMLWLVSVRNVYYESNLPDYEPKHPDLVLKFCISRRKNTTLI